MHTVASLSAALDDCGDTLPVIANGHHVKEIQVVETPVRHVALVLEPAPATFADVPDDASER